MNREVIRTLNGGIIGQYGIEQSFDAVIRGIPGQKRIEVDALGHEIRVLEVNEPQRGNDVFLTVDLNVQKVAEEALGGRNGAIVAMDPKNGEVLAMVSHPAFNPNLLSQGASSAAWEAILKDEGRPLTNRVIQGQYPPGSTFKIVMGAALLEMKEASPASRVECRGFLPFGNRNFRDWKRGGHGTVDLHKAMVESCDVYFYEMGNRLGVDNIAKFSHLFGLGHPTGIELASEKGGLIPSTEWKRQVRKEPWYPGETLSVSIGQGYVTTTPLQLAMMTTMVANKGISYPPQLLKKIWDRETGSMQEIPTAEGKRIPISPETFPGFACRSGRRRFRSSGDRQCVEIGVRLNRREDRNGAGDRNEGGAHGKLPDKFNDHAWFVAFAPVESPKIAVVVLVENGGHGGSAAAPLSKKLIEAYLGIASPLEPITVKKPGVPSECHSERGLSEPIGKDCKMIDRRSIAGYDWLLFVVVILILGIGVVSIYSVTSASEASSPLYMKQIYWIILGWVVFLVMAWIDYHEIARFAYPIYAVTLLLLVLVLLIGRTVLGSPTVALVRVF
ncbi:MAG: penicillin-binding protein 2 [Candidatus Manganitrophus sp.]|nr:MAG: penicillin-binding protein 2 [Candidatus Manganitrophus sp.]